MRFCALLLVLCCTLSSGGCVARTAPEKAPEASAVVAAPAECRYVDTSPYSAPEPLEITGEAGTKARFEVEIADTWARHQQGLMCRTSLGETRGMLFEFPDVRPRAFWMKNTLIPLDILYIGPDGEIVSIRRNARPLDTTPLPSGAPARAVLEIEGGLSDKLGIKPGDRVVHGVFQGK